MSLLRVLLPLASHAVRASPISNSPNGPTYSTKMPSTAQHIRVSSGRIRNVSFMVLRPLPAVGGAESPDRLRMPTRPWRGAKTFTMQRGVG